MFIDLLKLIIFYKYYNIWFMDFISGATVHACRKSGRHFLVMEEDEAIFKSVLKPLILEPVVEVSKKQCFEGEISLGASEEEVEPTPPTIVRLNRYST
jgi:hypothetical protein